jgi:hypothetical protein
MSGEHSVHVDRLKGGMSGGILNVKVEKDGDQTQSLTLRESVSNRLIGYVEITLVPKGARIQAWNADDSDVNGMLIVHAESS